LDAEEIINHLTQDYRDAEYIELEVRYKLLIDDVIKDENAFKDEWIQNHKCSCVFDEYKDSCIHLKKAIKYNKELKHNRGALWSIAMKMFNKTNNGLYYVTAEQFK
jgi:hypothetical protein